MNKVFLTDEELELAVKISKKIGYKWVHIEVEDLRQHLYEWLVVNHKQYVEPYREEGVEGRRKLYASMRREAGKWCAKETEKKLNIKLNNNNIYTRSQVVKALPYIWELTEETKGLLFNGENKALDILLDIKIKLDEQPEKIKQLIEWKYRDGKTDEELAELLNVNVKSVRQSVYRATTHLTDDISKKKIAF